MDIEEVHEHCLEDILKMKHALIEYLEPYILGDSDIECCEAGEIIDMIKDLAAAERYSEQACYYRAAVKAMHENPEHAMDYISKYGEAQQKASV